MSKNTSTAIPSGKQDKQYLQIKEAKRAYIIALMETPTTKQLAAKILNRYAIELGRALILANKRSRDIKRFERWQRECKAVINSSKN